jgi:hypothetical protein
LLRDVLLNDMGEGGEGRGIILLVYSESEDNDDVSGVKVDRDKELDDTSSTVGTGPSFYFFLLSYTYLTSLEFESQHIQALPLLHYFFTQSMKELIKESIQHLATSHHFPPLFLYPQYQLNHQRVKTPIVYNMARILENVHPCSQTTASLLSSNKHIPYE